MHTDTMMLWKRCRFTPIPLFLSSLHPRHSLLSITCKATESGMDAVPLQGLLAEPSAASPPHAVRALPSLLPPSATVVQPSTIKSGAETQLQGGL